MVTGVGIVIDVHAVAPRFWEECPLFAEDIDGRHLLCGIAIAYDFQYQSVGGTAVHELGCAAVSLKGIRPPYVDGVATYAVAIDMAGESEDGFVVEHLDMAFADLEFVARVDDSSTGKFGEPACGKVAPVLIVGGHEPSVGFGFFGLCTCFGQRHFVADDGHDEFTGPHFSLVEGAIDDFDALSLLDFLHKGRCCVCARYGKHAAESHENGCKISVLHRFFILFFMMNHNGSVSVLQQVLRQSRKVDYGICRTLPAPGVEYP